MHMPIVKQTVRTLSDSANKTPAAADTENTQNNFDDILDILNPLHHVPVVSSIYKEQANDNISNDSKVIGDVFYGLLTGGLLGVIAAIGNTMLKQETDKDVGQHLLAIVEDDKQNRIHKNQPAEHQYTQQHQNPLQETEQLAKQDDYWSVRMKQLFEDNYFIS